jgi:apolipoprotein N-acyltransferase
MYAVYFGLAGFAMSKCYRSDKTWMIPAVWAGMEVFRSYIPVLAFPWSLLASPLGRFPELIQGAYFGSIFFVTAFLIAVNTLAAEVFGRPKGKTWIWMLAWIAGYAALTFARTSMPKPATTPHKVAIIQPGTDMAFGDQASEFFRLSGKFQQLFPIARSQNPELIIMPEGLVKVPKMPPKPLPFPIPSDASILFGGQRSTKPTYQSSFMYDGTRWQYADKTRLVIFGEYVPFRHLIPSGFNLPAGDLEPSRGGIKQMKGPFGSIGPILCFEALFPDITWQHANADARLIAVMSLDDWFMETPAIEQLRTASVWRAVETGLPVVRVGALGTSMFVEPSGKVTEEVPLMVSAAVTEEIPVPNARASFIGFPAFAIASLLAFLGTLLLPMAAAKYRRKESS